MKCVTLNIGGHKYQTTKETLTKHPSNFFEALLKDKENPELDTEVCIFIDRDGEYFEPILTWLRTEVLSIPPTLSAKKLYQEAEFYQLEPLVDALNEHSGYFFEFHRSFTGVLPKYVEVFYSRDRHIWGSRPFLGVDLSDLTEPTSLVHAVNRIAEIGYSLCESTVLPERAFLVRSIL